MPLTGRRHHLQHVTAKLLRDSDILPVRQPHPRNARSSTIRERRILAAAAAWAQSVMVMPSTGWLLVLVAAATVASCADQDPPEQAESRATSDVVPTFDAGATSAAVLAAAVRYRVETYQSGYSTTLFIIDRVGRYSPDDGYITDWIDGRELTATERSAIATALEPRTVTWVSHWRDVTGESTSGTLPDRQAIILLAEPSIDGTRADVATELSCGGTCSYGATSMLEQSTAGDWLVTEETEGFGS